MKIWYEHPYGRLDKYDMQWTKVMAEVEPEEQEQALAQGFVDLGKHWLQVRSSRINIKEYIRTAPRYKQRKGVTVEKWSGSFALKHQDLLEGVLDQFLQHNQYKEAFILQNFEITDKETFYCYYFENTLTAWSVWTKYGHSIDNWQFAWDYREPQLHLGKYSMDHEIRTAYEKGYNWFYLEHPMMNPASTKQKFQLSNGGQAANGVETWPCTINTSKQTVLWKILRT